MGVTSLINRSMVNEGIGDSTSQSIARTVGVVESAMTLNVGSGQEFTTLQEALDWVEARVLLAEVTIQIADGTYNMASGVGHWFQHPNYQLVTIIGNTTTPANVTFNFSGGAHCFRINGSYLKYLGGLKIVGGALAIYVSHGGVIASSNQIECSTQTYMGIGCYMGSYMNISNVNVHNSTNHGIHCYNGSSMYINTVTSQNNGQHGIMAQNNSSIEIVGSITVSGNSSGDYNPSAATTENTTGSLITR